MANPKIHPTAIIDPLAELDESVVVGPYTIIGPRTRIEAGTVVGSHVSIGSQTLIGKNNNIYDHAIIGTDSQDLKFKGEQTGLKIGNNNIIREFVTINRATGEEALTKIGNHSVLLAYVHVAHNCRIGNHVILANASQIGGECIVEDYAGTGGLVGVHQFCRIGAHAFVGACSKVTQDIVPYLTADGHPARPFGLNTVGLKRRQFSKETLQRLRNYYREIFLRGQSLKQAVSFLSAKNDEEAKRLVDFICSAQRGIARPRRAPEQIEDQQTAY